MVTLSNILTLLRLIEGRFVDVGSIKQEIVNESGPAT